MKLLFILLASLPLVLGVPIDSATSLETSEDRRNAFYDILEEFEVWRETQYPGSAAAETESEDLGLFYDPSVPIPEFLCATDLPASEITTVHTLRPSDISVIGGFGDSISAGNGLGANNLAGVAVENRGESWYIGGNQTLATVLTIPNLIKEYNPSVTGWSWSRPGVSGNGNRTTCTERMECAQLNVAEPGARNEDMPFQADEMIRKMKELPDVDMENDWKLVSLFIGGNDLCAVCRNYESNKPETYLNNIKIAIEKIKDQVPRVLFQVVVMFDITPLANASTGFSCNYMHMQYCDCAVYNESVRSTMRPIQFEYWRLLDELINVNRTYDGNDTFTVVLQPHLRDIPLPQYPNGSWDVSFMAPDCFHFNRKGHQLMAYMLWEMMFTPVQDKPFIYLYSYNDTLNFKCPTQDSPYIFTNDNSRALLEWKEKASATAYTAKMKQSIDAAVALDPHRNTAAATNEIDLYTDFEDSIAIPPFVCDVNYLPDAVPTSVHTLRPHDIQVMGAFGDSITAGNGVGALTLPGVAIENRGESWSIGGNETVETVLTLPNLIKKYNPDVVGWSYSNPVLTDRNDSHCGIVMPCSRLNVAEPGATNQDIPQQADRLIQRILNSPDIDVDNDWKYVSLLIGGNDLCAVCRRPEENLPEYYVASIKLAIDKMKAALPRTLVMILAMFDISPLSNFTTGPVCDYMHFQYCDCAVYNESVIQQQRPVQLEYWELLDELININGTYDNDDNFTVVLQPHLRDLPPPKTPEGAWDMSYLAPDCFHPNRRGHQTLAYQMWNTMFIPVPDKPFFYQLEETLAFACPSADTPYIFTNDNSRVYLENKKKMTSVKNH